MKCMISLNDMEVYYDFRHKNVKNINLRIRPDGTINVSANRYVSRKVVDDFIRSKADFILQAIDKYKAQECVENTAYFSEKEIKDVIINVCKRVYPYFEKQGVEYPQIKFRKMVSRWGSCHSLKGIITFNTNLMYADISCIEYVVLHEFTHFLQPNHSGKFYNELEKVCPDWKERRKCLKKIILR